MDIDDVVVFKVEKARENDSRNTGDDFWIRMLTEGCGCCADRYTGLHTREQTIKFIKRWIEAREKEIEKWKQVIKEMSV